MNTTGTANLARATSGDAAQTAGTVGDFVDAAAGPQPPDLAAGAARLAGGGDVVLWSVDTSIPALPGYRTPSIHLRVVGADGTLRSGEAFVFSDDATGQPLAPARAGTFTPPG
ncbi:MAG TPA: hypothetical protein VFE82_09855 [Ramlibacter sp.]|jgi:hypothetical protein|uniref:hypothetical protein n=1 Tax=Ramlibacter sp. TaxID=1917967 RepID=UPI002D52753C|nr:hypothetical protein [Ramlibacter sp.]HZY18777.1 hypothetical protein [Ramlibacter sp.]